jgi:hypothetical protein
VLLPAMQRRIKKLEEQMEITTADMDRFKADLATQAQQDAQVAALVNSLQASVTNLKAQSEGGVSSEDFQAQLVQLETQIASIGEIVGTPPASAAGGVATNVTTSAGGSSTPNGQAAPDAVQVPPAVAAANAQAQDPAAAPATDAGQATTNANPTH